METGYELGQEMRPWVSPSLIEANYILSLSRLELQDVISAELEANPALEMEERQTCALCGGILEGTFCPTCLVSQAPPESTETYEDFPEQLVQGSVTVEDSDDFDPMSLIANDLSIQEQILADARTVLEEEEYTIAEFLVDALDARGFLTVDLANVAKILGVSEDEVRSVLEVVQDVAPVGVGARDLRECLLLQLNFLKASGHEIPPHVEEIVDVHLADFGAHKFGQIARALGITTEEVEAVRDLIRTHLSPFPLQAQTAKPWRSPSESAYVAPDVIIGIKDGDLMVEVLDTKQFHLQMNELYDQLHTTVSRRRSHDHGERFQETAPEEPEEDNAAAWERGSVRPQATEFKPAVNGNGTLANSAERDHVREYATRAKLFIANIRQRRETLLKISWCIAELQESFLRGGVRELRPLTRAIVAQHVGVHESTVSRATANKYVMLPNRKVIPFSDFFTPSLSTKDVIKELIERETRAGTTLTDRKICDLLLQQGIRIARRTVAKYRTELGILPSSMR